MWWEFWITLNNNFIYRLPIPRPGEVLGLVGTNGIGKSTALKILAGKQKPNLGKYDVCIKRAWEIGDYGLLMINAQSVLVTFFLQLSH